MSRTTSLRALATVVGLAVVNSCSPYSNDVFAPRPSPGGIFDQYVAIGNSITAGYQSGGLIDSTQRRAYPFLLADLAKICVTAAVLPTLWRATGLGRRG